jgi:hypothetical protein
MKNKKLIELIKEDLSKFGNEGNEVVEIERLTKYLTLLQDEMNDDDDDGLDVEKEAEIERIRSHYSSHLARYEWEKESSIEMFKSVISSGQNSLKSNMLMHAGACVALLAFVGNLASDSATRSFIPPIADAMLWFLGGVLLVSICYGATYLCQVSYHHEKNKIGVFIQISTSLLVIVCYALFIVGSYKSYLAIKGMI